MLRCDVTEDEDVQASVARVVIELGRLDVLVMMASTYEAVPLDNLDLAALDRQLAVDMRGTFLGMRAAVPHMRRAGGGRIINFSDWTAASGAPPVQGLRRVLRRLRWNWPRIRSW